MLFKIFITVLERGVKIKHYKLLTVNSNTLYLKKVAKSKFPILNEIFPINSILIYMINLNTLKSNKQTNEGISGQVNLKYL